MPASGLPYSRCLKFGSLLFVSGQVPLDPTTGKLVEGSFEVHVRRSLDSVAAILERAGSGMEHVLKTTVYLADMDTFGRMNAIYGSYFPKEPPARTTVQVARLPLDAQIEVEAIAYVPDSGGEA